MIDELHQGWTLNALYVCRGCRGPLIPAQQSNAPHTSTVVGIDMIRVEAAAAAVAATGNVTSTGRRYSSMATAEDRTADYTVTVTVSSAREREGSTLRNTAIVSHRIEQDRSSCQSKGGLRLFAFAKSPSTHTHTRARARSIAIVLSSAPNAS